MAGQRYVILDFETTDTDPSRLEIFEIGAILMEDLTPIKRFHTLVKPTVELPTAVRRITGVSNEMLSDAPSLESILPEFMIFLDQYPIVAHNAKFESEVVASQIAPRCAERSYSFHDSLDVLGLVLVSEDSLSEDALRRRFGIQQEQPHRALNDCEDLVKILQLSHEIAVSNQTLLSVIESFLSPAAESWWWSWFFPKPKQSIQIESLFIETNLGDLKELRETDSMRTRKADAKVEQEKIRDVLRGHESAVFGTEEKVSFEYRPQQETMAEEVRAALEKGANVLIEAPTGTGKSVAYLLPGYLNAKTSGFPLVVSTGGKSLQDQLLTKDKTIVENLLGEEINLVTVKGQENYFCLRKLNRVGNELLESQSGDVSNEERWAVAYLFLLALARPTAEVTQASWFFQMWNTHLKRLLGEVKSHNTTTVGELCPFYSRCRYFNSARVAHAADVIVANHALVFSWPSMLPKIRDVVFDEAHHLEDQITRAFEYKVKEEEIIAALDELLYSKKGKNHGGYSKIVRLLDKADFPEKEKCEQSIAEMVARIRTCLREFNSSLPSEVAGGWTQFRHQLNLSDSSISEPLNEPLNNLLAAVRDLAEYLRRAFDHTRKTFDQREDSFRFLIQETFQFSGFVDALARVLDSSNTNLTRTVEFHPSLGWEACAAEVAIQESGKQQFSNYRSVVLTSATLCVPRNPGFVSDRVGLPLSKPPVVLASPYKLKDQVYLYLPKDIPIPRDSKHLDTLIEFTAEVAKKIGGKTFLLLCANTRARIAVEKLRVLLEPHGIEVIDGKSSSAIETFKGHHAAVLVGSEMHGEGIDIPGKALSCVIIEKINERMTMDTLSKAREAAISFGLINYTMMRRMLWLKQRIGRLVRSATDTGWVIVFDSRYYSWSPFTRGLVQTSLEPIELRQMTLDEILAHISETRLSVLPE